MWLCGRTVANINTGINTIESKKANTSKFKTFLKTLALCMIGAFITFLFSISYIGSAYMNGGYIYSNGPMNNYLYYAMSIFNVILVLASRIILLIVYFYLLFMFIDIIAKGSTIKNSAKNVYINFVYSKNKIIKKVVAGGVSITVILVVLNVLYSLCIFIVLNTPIINQIYMYSHALVTFSIIVMGIVVFFINVFYLQYMYLVYMLNEVEEVRKPEEIKEIKKDEVKEVDKEINKEQDKKIIDEDKES